MPEGWAVLPVMAAGVGGLLIVPRIARLLGRWHGRHAKWMLVGSLGSRGEQGDATPAA